MPRRYEAALPHACRLDTQDVPRRGVAAQFLREFF
jgi:hypothetical protein